MARFAEATLCRGLACYGFSPAAASCLICSHSSDGRFTGGRSVAGPKRQSRLRMTSRTAVAPIQDVLMRVSQNRGPQLIEVVIVPVIEAFPPAVMADTHENNAVSVA